MESREAESARERLGRGWISVALAAGAVGLGIVLLVLLLRWAL